MPAPAPFVNIGNRSINTNDIYVITINPATSTASAFYHVKMSVSGVGYTYTQGSVEYTQMTAFIAALSPTSPLLNVGSAVINTGRVFAVEKFLNSTLNVRLRFDNGEQSDTLEYRPPQPEYKIVIARFGL